MTRARYAIGDTVVSIAVGIVPAFRGIVADVFVIVREQRINGAYHTIISHYYHVATNEGVLWHRDDADLTPVAASLKEAA